MGEVAQKAIIEKEGKVLLVRFPKDEVFEIPGGRLNKNEQPRDGLAREIKEELGIDVTLGEPCYVAVVKFVFDNNDRYVVCFRALLKDASEVFTLDPNEVCEIKWIGKEEVETVPMYDVYREGLRAYFAQK